MTYVTKIKGCAGGGKSYSTREILFEAVANGEVEPWQSCIASFTRAATQDVEDGLYEAVEKSDELLDSIADDVDVVTFNSLCLRVARETGFEDSELIALDSKGDEEVFREFFDDEMLGINFKTPNAEDFEIDSPGAKMVHEYNLIRAEGETSIEDFARKSQGRELGCTRPGFIQFVTLWEAWKRDTGNRQHDDYVEYVRKNELAPTLPHSDETYSVLVLDEFQDLNPLQYDVYKTWRDSEVIDHIIIAGDAAQSVYGFRGADPRYFEKTPAHKEIELAESRRCAPDVVEYADEIIAGEGYFDSKLSSTRSNGEQTRVEKNYRVQSIDGVTRLVKDHTEKFGSTFVLARRNKDVVKIARALNDTGIPHTSVSPAAAEKYEGLWYWDDPLPDLRLLFRNWEKGKCLSPLWVRAFLQNSTIENEYTYRVEYGVKRLLREDEDAPNPDRHGMCPPEVMDYVTDGMSLAEALATLDLDESRVDALKNALRSGVNVGSSQVRIGTIHSAKGLECDAAIIMGYTTEKQLKKLNEGGEELREEKRLYHVGVTRAQDSVVIVSGVFGSKRSPVLP